MVNSLISCLIYLLKKESLKILELFHISCCN